MPKYRSAGDLESVTRSPPPDANAIARRDAQLRQAGFRKCVNQLCKHRGMESYSSYYLSADGTTLLLDCATRKLLGGYPSKFSTALRSLCADGHMVETSSHNKLPRMFVDMPPEAMFTVAVVGSDELHLLVDEHQKQVSERLEFGNSELIPISENCIREIETYGLLVVDWQLHRTKQVPKPETTASDYFRDSALGLAEAV